METSVTFLGEFSRKLIANTFFNLLGRSWRFLVALLLTPYVLSHLNVGDFGTWVLLSVFITSFNLLDLGLGVSFVKYISTYYTHRDYDRINQAVFSGLAFYGLFGIALTLFGLALEGPLFRWFRLVDASDIYLLALLSCSVQNIAGMFLSVLQGMQRMDKSNSVEIKASILNLIGTVFFLEQGWGLFGLAVNALINALLGLLLAWWTVRRTLPDVRLGWHFSMRMLRDMFGYGTRMQVSRLGGLICFQIDKLIISRFLGIAAVSFYEVSSRLTSFMRAVPLVLISALIPATSELGARNDRAKILQIYTMASKYVVILTVAMVVYLVLEARSVVFLWVGQGFEQSVVLVQILAIGYGVNIMGGAASQTGAGIGHPEFDMRSTILLSVINPILSLLLVREFGAPGAAAGTSVALVLATVYLLMTFHNNYVGDSVWRVFRGVHLRPIVSGVLAVLAVLVFHRAVPQMGDLDGVRYLVPIKLIIDFTIFVPIYVALLIALRQVTAADWKNFLGLISFGFNFLRHPFREHVKVYR